MQAKLFDGLSSSGRVAFARDVNGIVCQSRDLDRAIPASDPTLARYARQHLEALLARPNASTADKVRELVWLQWLAFSSIRTIQTPGPTRGKRRR